MHTILLAIIVMSLVFIPFCFLMVPDELGPNLLIIGASITVFGGDLWLLQRGHLQVARRIFAVFFSGAILVVAIAFDGIYDTSLTAFFLLAGITGLIGGGRAAFLSSIFGVFGLIVVYVVDYVYGGIELPLQPPLMKVVEMSGLLLVLGLVLRMTLSDLTTALAHVRAEVAERKAIEAELVEARDGLEERVAERTEALSRANQDLHTLIETTHNGVIFLTNQGEIAVINSRALALLGVRGDADGWQGRNLRDLMVAFVTETGARRDEMEAEAAKIVESPQTPMDGELVLPDRNIRWHYAPTTVGEAMPAQLVVLSDVTEQRQAEQMRNDLISTMVHDLRNPLSGMLSLLSTLAWMDEQGRETLSARQRRYVERSMETVRQMNQLVSNILDVSRLESGQMPVQPDVVPLREVILETVAAQEPLAAAKQLSVLTEIPPLPPARADVVLVERVLQNLLDNAIKFTPGGGEIRVLAGMAGGNGSGERIEISVADTGPGIPAALRPSLFQKFASGADAASGSGLGLAFCKLAVAAHGGEICLASDEGQGAVFRFTLPAA